jgi:hypothetical protein
MAPRANQPAWNPEDYLRPSTSYMDFLWAYAPAGTHPDMTERGGKWIVFASREHIDEVWEQIKQATKDGRLGPRSKVSTMLHAHKWPSPMICVYTYDGDDEADVMRVREVLRTLGWTGIIGWKADSETLAGRYATKGQRVTRYRA